jgi:Tfp pilus assembly protein PilO
MVDISIKSKKWKLIVGSVLCVLAVGLMLSLVKKNIEIVAGLRDKITTNENDLVVLERIHDDAIKRRLEIDRVLATIPSNYEDVSTYAKVLEAVASGTGVTAEVKFDSSERKETAGIYSIGVAIKTTGLYEDLVKYVDQISELPYHIEIDSMGFERSAGGVSLSIVYRLYSNINKQ